ncbi:MAG: TonB-dependent receptor [Lentisphaeraceae bacterium]|nr:TonB-dependent receptor [Lentisphaeraceae bacterium]
MEKRLLFIFCCLTLSFASAEEASSRLLKLNKEHIVVTASRSERLESTLPANVTVITQEDIQKSTAQNLPDVFKHLAGVDVREEFGDFSNTAVDIRGFGEVAAANTLIMVDGRKLNRSDLAATNYSTVPLNRIEQIEVYRGGRSVLYGNGATGGVINIITKKDRKDGHTLTLQSEFGTQESYKFSTLLEGKVGKTTYSLDSSYSDTNGWRENNYERFKNAGFSVFIQELEDWDFLISGNLSEISVGTPSTRPAGGSRKDSSNKIGYFDIEENSVSFSPRYWINDDVSIELGSSYREAESELKSSSGAISTNEYYSYSLNPKLKIDNNFDGIKNTTIVGLDYNYSKVVANGTSQSKNNLLSYGYYIHNTTAFMDDSLFLDLGYRRERYYLDSKGNDFSPEDLDAASMSLTYRYAEASKVFISYDKSFRYQRVDELGGAAFNEALAPQKSYTFQTGVSHTFNEQWKASLTYFNIETDNEIFFDPTIGSFGQNTSYGETERDGFELELNYHPTEELRLFLNISKIEAELGGDDASLSANKGNEIPVVPQETINAGFSWDFMPHFNFSLAGKWADRYYVRSDFSNTRDQDDGYIVVDSKLTFTWDWFSIYAGCNNMFDEGYNSNAATFGSYPAPGRNFFGGVSMTFEF